MHAALRPAVRIRFVLLAAALALGLAGGPAGAAPILISDILSSFNAIVAGDFSTGHDVEGSVVVGGNLSGNGSFLNKSGKPSGAFAGYAPVSVYGGAAGSRFNANGMDIRIGGAKSDSSFSGASSVTYGYGFPVTFGSIWKPLVQFGSSLAALSPGKAAALPAAGSNNAVLTATPGTVNGSSNIAVINISGELLSSYRALSVALNGATTVIINVSGQYTGQPNFQNAEAWRGNVIWNFVDATKLDFGSTGFQGTVLAPLARVTNNNPIEGTLIAAGYVGNGELHWKPFQGDSAFINNVSSFTTTSQLAVPEPATLALLGVGIAGLLAARRRGG